MNKGEQSFGNKGFSQGLTQKSEGQIFGTGAFGAQIWRWIKGKVPFYPLFQNFFINRKLPIYVDMNNIMLVYLSVPVLRAIIDKKAELMRNAKLCVYKADDYKKNGCEAKEIDHAILKLLKNPNPLQNWHDFIAQHSSFQSIYSNSFIFKMAATPKAFPKVLWNLPPGEMKIIPTGNLFFETKIENIISNYVLWNSGQYEPIEFKPNEIMHLSQGTSDKYFFGESKILTNKIIISNIDAAYKTRNILLNEKGAIGILSDESSGGAGGMPLLDDEKVKISKAYENKYGLGEDQMKIIMTSAKVKWQPMSFPTKDLMLFEEVADCAKQLMDAYGVDSGIFADNVLGHASNQIGGDGQGKVEEAMKITLQNTIQQELDAFLELFVQDPQFELEGYVLKGSFAHLPCMQENELEKEQIQSEKVTSYSEITSSVIALNSQVISGTMEREVAVSVLTDVHNMESSMAEKLITKQEAKPPQVNTYQNDDAKRLKDNYYIHSIFVRKTKFPTLKEAVECMNGYCWVNENEVIEKSNGYLYKMIPLHNFLEDSFVTKLKPHGVKLKMGIIKPEYQYNFKP